jgi:hypothetical protein
VALYAILRCEVYDTLLQSLDISSHAQACGVEVDDGVAHKLPRTMECYISTTVYMIELGTKATKILLGAEHILLIAALAKGVDCRVLDHKDGATWLILRKTLLELLTTQRVE